jgi:hypothetical protein
MKHVSQILLAVWTLLACSALLVVLLAVLIK